MNPELKKNLSSGDHWIRALYVILFLLFAKVAGFLIALVAVVQIIFSLVTGELNRQLLRFGDSLAQYLSAVFVFVVGKSEEKPFPFADWPVSEIPAEVESEQSPENDRETSQVQEQVEEPNASETEPTDTEGSESIKDDSDNADSNEKPKV